MKLLVLLLLALSMAQEAETDDNKDSGSKEPQEPIFAYADVGETLTLDLPPPEGSSNNNWVFVEEEMKKPSLVYSLKSMEEDDEGIHIKLDILEEGVDVVTLVYGDPKKFKEAFEKYI